MLSYTVMSLVDTLVMGHVSTAAQAGVGLATTFAFACLGRSGRLAGPHLRDRCRRRDQRAWRVRGLGTGSVGRLDLLLGTT